MTKTETRNRATAHKREWSAALAAGRVLSFPELSQMRAYPTLAMMTAAKADADAAGIACHVVTPLRAEAGR